MNEEVGIRLELFPFATTCEQINGHTHLAIAGCDLAGLAEKYGTPLYVYDRATLDENVRLYKDALSAGYPSLSGITYAGKAYLCLAIAQWSQTQDL
jgi:diaminopimelate decarboxylase